MAPAQEAALSTRTAAGQAHPSQHISIKALEMALKAANPPRHGPDHCVDVYLSDSALLRRFFWLRIVIIERLIERVLVTRSLCTDRALDLGGGIGLVTALMSSRFDSVTMLDLDTSVGRNLHKQLGLTNIAFVEEDAVAYGPRAVQQDLIVAADVLEHFQNLDPIIRSVDQMLASGGVLITSLPTESRFYRFLRLIFGKKKPPDHYHDARTVELALQRAGYRPLERRFLPLGVPVLSLFSIVAWVRAK
jgi:predicted TPR repeat methyltransferase